MTDEELVAYRDSRYEEALKYYDKRANTNRVCHRICSIYVLVASVAVTPILTIPHSLRGCEKLIAAVLASTVAIATGIAAHFRFHENWLGYRATWDALQHELHWRNAQVQDYKNSEDRNALFVEKVEALMSKEGTEWLGRHARKENVGPSSR